MKSPNIYVLLILFLFVFTSSYSQKKVFKGKVLVFDNIPVMNAEILVNSTKQIVKSNSEGNFSFKGKPIEKIKISANGFAVKNQRIKGNANFHKINLRLKNSKKYQQIAINSGHIKDIAKFQSLLVDKKNNNKDYTRYNTIVQIIREEFPSLDIKDKGIIIRGKCSFLGTSHALIEVDGLPVQMSELDEILPSSIKSINVLTSSNAATYGSRGAHGVVVIKTKQGMR